MFQVFFCDVENVSFLSDPDCVLPLLFFLLCPYSPSSDHGQEAQGEPRLQTLPGHTVALLDRACVRALVLALNHRDVHRP